MGKKVNRIGFRLAVTEPWRSRWYATKANFAAFILEDKKIRNYIRKNCQYAAIPKMEPRTFQGYRRKGGQVGTRNYIAVCATVNCSATVIRRAAEQVMASGILADYPNVDGVVAFAHGTGCGMAASGPGFDNLQRVLWGHATHPNVGAAVFVGLGCEVMQIARMKGRFGASGAERFHGTERRRKYAAVTADGSSSSGRGRCTPRGRLTLCSEMTNLPGGCMKLIASWYARHRPSAISR